MINGYAAVAKELSTGSYGIGRVAPPVMGLIGFEVWPHKRLGHACRRMREGGQWQSLPNFRSADDAVIWLCNDGGEIGQCGRNDDGTWFAEFKHPDYGNDFGSAPSLGGAIWVAFVRLFGKVDDF